MKTNSKICSALAFLLLCSYAVCLSASEQSEAVGIVLDILRSNDQEMQAAAIAMVKEMPGKQVTEALAKELPNLSAKSQVQLISAFGDRGDVAARPAVVAAVKSEDQSVRIAALRALGQLGNGSSVELLAQAAAGAKGAEQKAARDSLYRLRGQNVDKVILAAIPKAEAETKVELISSVGQRNITTGVATLLETAKDSDRKVRTGSLRTLKVVAGPENLPALVELLIKAKSSSDRTEAQKTIAAVAHRIADKNHQASSVLAALPSVKETAARCSLLNVLGRIGDNSALPVLNAALKDENVDIQTAAIRALADWPTSEPTAELMKIAENSGNKVHRILALRGFVRLLGLASERPTSETIELYKKAMSLAPDAGEKKKVLSGLANMKSLAALQMAVGYLGDKALSVEAGAAVVNIAGDIYADYPEQAKDMLNQIIKTTKSDSLRQQAQELINNIEQDEEK
ncbi:MAG: HEAT repeat domain-containing protein [Candidatus Hydrogenedentota bacterium]|nr:MAG: HEAT repeat domain-containing protein [Candidatus Hydrogenedentota bacterium]